MVVKFRKSTGLALEGSTLRRNWALGGLGTRAMEGVTGDCLIRSGGGAELAQTVTSPRSSHALSM